MVWMCGGGKDKCVFQCRHLQGSEFANESLKVKINQKEHFIWIKNSDKHSDHSNDSIATMTESKNNNYAGICFK